MRALLAAATALLALAAPAQPDDLLPAPAEVRTLPAGRHPHMFQTRRFVIASDAPLNRADVERFSQVVDTVPLALARLPLPLLAPPDAAPALIEVLADAPYEEAAGSDGSSGFYDSRTARLLVRRSLLLQPPQARASRLAPAPDQDLLVHELTHLCMHRHLGRTPQWFAEGACEYLACLHQADGRFSFRDVDAAIRIHLRQRYRADDPTVELTPPRALAGLSAPDWLKLVSRLPPEHRYRPYATSLLLFHYHLHGGEPRRAELRARLAAALEARRPRLRWLDPAALPALQQALARYWQPRGLHLRFTPG